MPLETQDVETQQKETTDEFRGKKLPDVSEDVRMEVGKKFRAELEKQEVKKQAVPEPRGIFRWWRVRRRKHQGPLVR